MSRLSVKLTLAFVGVTLVTILLLVVPQLRGIASENVALPPEERPQLTPATVGRALLQGRATSAGSSAAFTATLRGVEVRLGDTTLMVYIPESGDPATWLAAVPGGPVVRDLPASRWEELRALSFTATGRFPSRSTSGQLVTLDRVAAGVGQAEPEPQAGPAPQAADDPALQTVADTVSRSTLLAYVRGSLERRTVALVGSAAAALALAVVLALVLARLIARPIEGVTVAAGRIAAGDLSARIPLGRRRQRSESETARLAASFNAMADSLQALEASRRAMVADIAHELRTPLTVMRGRLEAMEDGVVDLSIEEVRDLHAQVLVLSRLVDDLRTLSLADAGRLSLRVEEVDLSDLARLAAASYRVQADAKRVRLDVAAPGTAPVLADRERLMQVIGNLLDNAIRHTPEEGRVLLAIATPPGQVTLEVRDTGPGVPPGQERRIFERFVRTDDARSRASGGSGIGLAIVKALVELHRGHVRASNAPDGGAVFRVELPA